MYLKSKKFSISYKLILIVVCMFGLLLNFGVFDGRFDFKVLRFFTVLSNLFCFVYFIISVIYLKRNFLDENKTTFNPTLKGIATMSITVTLLVAHFLLGGGRFIMGTTLGISMLLSHYIVPIMMILDWLLFDKKGYITKTSPLIWSSGHLLYFLYIVVSAQFGGIYTYPFIDVDTLGWSRVLLNVLVLTIFFIVLGYISLAVDKILLKISGKERY
jgi:hypothetical protein